MLLCKILIMFFILARFLMKNKRFTYLFTYLFKIFSVSEQRHRKYSRASLSCVCIYQSKRLTWYSIHLEKTWLPLGPVCPGLPHRRVLGRGSALVCCCNCSVNHPRQESDARVWGEDTWRTTSSSWCQVRESEVKVFLIFIVWRRLVDFDS